MEYTSRVHKQSESCPGVEYTVARLSLSRRIELGQRIREIGSKHDFLAASKSVLDQIDAGLLQRRIDQAYLEWGLMGIRGLKIDGIDATPGSLIELGPEPLVKEILGAIRAELQLTEQEIKN
jgi:hypothetical protein